MHKVVTIVFSKHFINVSYYFCSHIPMIWEYPIYFTEEAHLGWISSTLLVTYCKV